MLLSLHVKNLAIIDEEEIFFDSGLNILSGETGAGKSIILGALSLAMGEKPGKGIIRDENQDALAEAVFSLNDRQKELLSAMDIDTDEGEVILQRKITPQRSIAKINGENVPAGKLRGVAELFIDIYGQKDGHTLLSDKNQILLLDEYAGEALTAKMQELKTAYEEYRSIQREFDSINSDSSQREREADLLSHEIKEIEAAGLKPGEDEFLKDEYRRLTGAGKVLEAVNEALDSVGEDTGERIGRAIRALRQVGESGEISQIIDVLSDAETILSDAGHSLVSYRESLEIDPKEIESCGMRLDLVESLKRKFSSDNTIEGVFAILEENQDKLAKLLDFDNYINKITKNLETSKGRLMGLCDEVTAIRKSSADALSKKITEALCDLNIEGEGFEIRITPLEEPTSQGSDRVIFYISTNPGEPMRPLNDIASGGELSRIMLAIKTIFAGVGEIDTLVFDEIDTGISGKTASKVAGRIASLSGDSQVICITHLPQIAARAKHHFLIEKKTGEGHTISSIRLLSPEERVDEVARMLAGDDITEAARENARNLILG